ncbi:MAG: exopolysaccharide biosynthesis protein [Phormidesmis sp.]
MPLRFSQELILLLEKERDRPLTLGVILAETSERSFSLVIILLIFPFLLPMIPGATTVLGSACLFLSLQMAKGQHTPWLPARIARFELSEPLVTRLLGGLRRGAKTFERLTKPRWSRLVVNNRAWQLNGICISWLTLLLMLPVPLTNPIPAIGILLLAISTIEMDGLLMVVGYALVGLNTALFGSFGYLLWRSPEMIQQWLL